MLWSAWGCASSGRSLAGWRRLLLCAPCSGLLGKGVWEPGNSKEGFDHSHGAVSHPVLRGCSPVSPCSAPRSHSAALPALPVPRVIISSGFPHPHLLASLPVCNSQPWLGSRMFSSREGCICSAEVSLSHGSLLPAGLCSRLSHGALCTFSYCSEPFAGFTLGFGCWFMAALC